MAHSSGFHEGELAVQRRAGVEYSAARNFAGIREVIPRGAISFLREQRMVVIGGGGPEGDIWASVAFGPEGFLNAADNGRSLLLDIPASVRGPNDPLWRNVRGGDQAGLLAIDLSTRRRLRINGVAFWMGADQLRVDVEEAFGNCPKYIQRRVLEGVGRDGAETSEAGRTGQDLDLQAIEAIRLADTFFIASRHPERGVDVSHRGGHAGFVEVVDARTLRIPDYSGNNMFNTLGNLAVDPKAGITVPEFRTGRQLQLTGTTEIVWDQPDQMNATGGTGRFWLFRIERWVESGMASAPGFRFIDYSPFNPRPVAG